MKTVSDYIFQTLKKHGAGHIFMLSGGGCMYLCNALGRSGLPYTCCLHEQAAAIAALAYAQYNNNIGISLVTSGPGATNAITGVMAAWTESVPLVILSGQVKTEDFAQRAGVRVRGVQEAPIIEMVKSITKYAVTVENPADIKYHLEKAIFLAKNKRPGPVWLDIPLNIQSSEVDEENIRGFLPSPEERTDIESYIPKIIEMINHAERPVILAGYGIRLSNSVNIFLDLIKKLNIPVLTTWKAADIIPGNHSLYMGRPGIAGQRAANFIQQNADLLITIGARLDFPQTGFNQLLFAREAKKIIIDVDPAELKKFGFTVDYPVCADIHELINQLNKSDLSIDKKDNWIEQCRIWRNTYPLVLSEHYQKKDYVSLYVLIETISDLLTKNDLIVPGSSGMGSDVSYQVTRIKEGQRMVNSPGLGSMGFGVPSALGACIASNKKRTICVNGDGGFQMNIQELETIKSLDLPIKFFVLNNQGYASIRNTQRTYFNGFYVGSSKASGVSLPNIQEIAKAYGFNVFTISNNAEIKNTVADVLESNGPAICEVILNVDDTLSLKASSRIKSDGTAISAPVEDLFPFLPRKELYQNMYIKPINKTGINICSVIFDLDGTIIDSKPGIISSMKYALDENNITCYDDAGIAKTIGLPLKDMVAELTPGIGNELIEKIIASYRKHYAEQGVYDCTLYEGIEKTLQALSEEFDLYIVTSKLLAMANKALAHFKLDRYFVDIKGIESDYEKKSKSWLIKKLLEEHHIDSTKSIMVGDRIEDIMAAKENNIKTIAVSYGYGNADEFHDALLIVKSVGELAEVIY